MIVEHHIQRQILRELVKGEHCRFRDLKPKNIESNLFMYHMKQLTRGGLVVKEKEGYSLTKEGRQHADRSNLPSMKLRLQPKQITIPVVSCGNKYVFLKRMHVPYMNCSGFPSGKIHYGETLKEAAERELFEKTGLCNVELRLRGNVLMCFRDPETNDVTSHINAYIFSGSVEQIELDYNNEFFHSYIGEATELEQEKTFQGHCEIVKLLARHPNNYFVEEFSFVSDF